MTDHLITADDLDLIVGSSSDPYYLAETHGIAKKTVDALQMGLIDFPSVLASAPVAARDLDQLASQAFEKLNLDRMRERAANHAALRAKADPSKPTGLRGLIGRVTGR